MAWQMFDEALLNIVLGADNSDTEDLFLRVALAVTLRGTDTLFFDGQPAREEYLAA
jgi:hypothetical protein